MCQQLSNGSAAILYFTNTEKFGRSTAASQYFLQMAGFLGIPVIAWNADNTGLESVSLIKELKKIFHLIDLCVLGYDDSLISCVSRWVLSGWMVHFPGSL